MYMACPGPWAGAHRQPRGPHGLRKGAEAGQRHLEAEGGGDQGLTGPALGAEEGDRGCQGEGGLPQNGRFLKRNGVKTIENHCFSLFFHWLSASLVVVYWLL